MKKPPPMTPLQVMLERVEQRRERDKTEKRIGYADPRGDLLLEAVAALLQAEIARAEREGT